MRDRIERGVTIVPVPLEAAKAAGAALANIRKEGERAALAVDAMVVAFAALYGGGLVYTSDIEDLGRLGGAFPSTRVLGI